MPPKPHHKSALWYGGGHWHKTAQAIAEIIALERGYEPVDARIFLSMQEGFQPDLVIQKRGHHHFLRYAIEIVNSHPPPKDRDYSYFEDVLLLRRSDMQNPDSLKELFTLAKKVIP